MPASTTQAYGNLPHAVPTGFELKVVAHVPQPRELAFTPNGNLIIGTLGSQVYVLPQPEQRREQAQIFADIHDPPDAGVAVGDGAVYVGTQHGIWRIDYRQGDERATAFPQRIARLRPRNQGGHATTTLTLNQTTQTLYASIGSSCDACEESDPTRATIQAMQFDGYGMHPIAVRIRNPIALAVNPATQQLWAGNAGQDYLATGHPYDFFDPVTVHPGIADYGWPNCYENHTAAHAGAACTNAFVPRVVFPAYTTPTGAAFYPINQHGGYAFGEEYDGGAFVSLHGSWHRPLRAPLVVFVPMSLTHPDEPRKAVNWQDPTTQWNVFLTGFQRDSKRIGRPTGIAVGPEGSLFVADDYANVIYRIRSIRGTR